MVVNASHEEQVAAITKIVANLFEQTVPNVTVSEPRSSAPMVLNFQLPDSRFRYLMFCLATVHAVCARRMKKPDAVLNDCAYRIVSAAVSYQGSDGIFREPVDAQKAANDGAGYLGDFLDRWSAYIEITKGSNVRAGTSLVANMLRETESLSPATANDGSRLWPLAAWIEGRFDEIQRAFGTLAEGSKNLAASSAMAATVSASSVSPGSWLCSDCGRRVPGKIDRCRCGRLRSENRSWDRWWQTEKKRVGDHFSAIFSGRSKGWWIGFAAAFVLLILLSGALEVDIRNLALPITLAGGVIGDSIASRVSRVKEELDQDTAKASRLRRRTLLAVGVLLFVVNILPEYRPNVFSAGGGYYWSTPNSLLAGAGAVLALLALVTKPKDQAF